MVSRIRNNDQSNMAPQSNSSFIPYYFIKNDSLLTTQKTGDEIGKGDLLIQDNPRTH